MKRSSSSASRIQQLGQAQDNDAMKRFSSSAGGGNAVPRFSWQREDNEKSLSQL